ncbi:hypothetical protein [Haloprofundus salinisoli]|uniref:hypothetical protein n=1 Tax=Haloprofundus salinisoli TaxID=2876193 RepID=UPI001CCB9835|nr:hypothetical protein [Haloprofundus salinisoli]
MARLYEYAASNTKSGYFLRGGSSDGNYTMRATDLGRRLFDSLDYDPGIVNRERGPRIPSQLQWAMYDVGLLKTGDSEPSGTGIDGGLDAEDAEITEEMIAQLEEFVLGEDSDREEILKLAEILDIDPKDDSLTPIWELSKFEGQGIVSIFESKLDEIICTEDAPNWEIDVRHTPEIPGPEGTTTFHVDIKHPEDGDEIYTHQMYYVADENSDTPGLATMTKVPVDVDRRLRIDRQRGRVLEAMSHVPQLAGIYAGDPTVELNCIILEEVLD